MPTLTLTGRSGIVVMARLAWSDPLGGLRLLEGSVPDGAVWEGQLLSDGAASPGPAGVYRLLSDEVCATLDYAANLPTFLHETMGASLITWMRPLEDVRLEATVAEQVRQAVFEIVEERIKTATPAYWTSTVVTFTEEVNGALHVVGRCVLVDSKAR